MLPCTARRGRGGALEAVIRPATLEDSGPIAYAAYLAGQGHTRASTYDLMVPGRPGPTADRIYSIKRLVSASTVSWLHYSHYLVAEIDGRVAASLGAFAARDSGNIEFVAALRETGWTDEEISRMSSDISIYTRVEPSVPREAWLIENAAALPEFRRRGLVSGLLRTALDNGREAGHHLAQLTCHIGNDAALNLYVSAGFEIAGQLTDPEFEAVFDCPGMWKMTCLL